MKIEFTKVNQIRHEIFISRENGTSEKFKLNTDCYLMHDLVHYVVEKKMNFRKGLWGLLSNGYRMDELAGCNPDMEELKFIEKLVGPAMSVCMGYFKADIFMEMIRHLEIEVHPDFINDVKNEVAELYRKWEFLPFNESMILCWDVS